MASYRQTTGWRRLNWRPVCIVQRQVVGYRVRRLKWTLVVVDVDS